MQPAQPPGGGQHTFGSGGSAVGSPNMTAVRIIDSFVVVVLFVL